MSADGPRTFIGELTYYPSGYKDRDRNLKEPKTVQRPSLRARNRPESVFRIFERPDRNRNVICKEKKM